MKHKAILFGSALAVLVTANLSAQDAFSASLEPSEDSCVARAIRPWADSGELPGAISIVCNGSTTEVSCVGFADTRTGRGISLDDPFMQCSQTKGFCGVTAAILVEEGRLSLDDPVAKYLPEFATLWVKCVETNDVRMLVKARTPLTVRMCLNHTGGFPFELPAKHANIPGGGWSGGMPLRSVAATAASQPLRFEPGTQVLYSNTGIDVAAAVIQTIVGKPWEDFLKERVLDPLGMEKTCFKPTDEQLARQIELYDCHEGAPATWKLQHGNEQRPYNGDHVFPSAGAGLWTTARDQVKFYRMLMNGGIGDNGVRILREETVRTLLAKSSRPEELGGYSLGLNAAQDGSGWFGHGGAWGTNCQVNMDKKQLKLWVVQLNGNARPWNKARDAAEDAFFAQTLDRTDENAYTGRME